MANDLPPDGFEDHPPDGYEEKSPSNFASTVSTLARPILEMGGAVGGSALTGGPETPVGIAGGVMGYAAGKSAADLLSRQLGTMPPIKDLTQAIKETGSNIEKGAEVEAGNLVLNPITQKMGILAKKGASAYFGPSEEAISARLTNPDLASASYPKTAQDLADHLNELQGHLNDVEDKVWGSLLKLKAEPKSAIMGMLNKIKGDLKITGGPVVSEADQTAYNAINRLSDKIKSIKQPGISSNLEQMLDQNQLREIIQSVSKDINWDDPYATSKNESLTNFRHYLSDYLKTQNPKYADLIQQSAERTALLENAQHSFSLNKQKGEFIPSDATANKIKSMLKEGKLQTQQVAGQVNNLTGMDIQNQAQMAKYADEFEKTATQGSRRANIGKAIGAGVGAMTGHSIGGGAVGAMVGGWLDKYAAQNLGATLDAINRLGLNQAIPIGPLGLTAAIASQTDQNQ